MKKIFILVSFAVLLLLPLFAYSKELSADEIVEKANHASLYQGDDIKGKISIEIIDRLGRKRKRSFNMMRKNVAGTKAQKYYVLFLKPADIKKMVFMVLKHGVIEKDDDRWLYMPGLDLVKRIAASDKRTSFAGSDFLYEDISGRNPKEDKHYLIDTTDKHYLMKSVPIKKDSVEFEYYKTYIDKKTFLPVKIEYYKKNNRLFRQMKTLEIKNISSSENNILVSYPTVVLSSVEDFETQSISKMKLEQVEYNTKINDRYFSERYLRKPPRKMLR